MWQDLLGSILKSFFGTAFGIGGTYASNKVNAAHLTGAEQEQNAFNAQMMENAQEFNAGEAQKSRDFTADMDNTLYQRRVADMRAAGVNPALAIGGVSSGTISTAAASSTPASGSGRGVPTSMSEIMQAAMFKKNAELVDSQIEQNEAETLRKMKESGLIDEQTKAQRIENAWAAPLNEARLNDLLSAIGRRDVQNALDNQGISESKAREALTLTQNALAKIDYSFRAELSRAQLRLTIAQAAQNEAKIGEIEASINELQQRAIMEAMQAGKYSAEELESMERAGLIRLQTEEQGITNEQKRYEVDRKGWTYWSGFAKTATGVISDLAGIGIRGYAASAFGKSGAFGRGINVAQRAKDIGLKIAPANSFNPYHLPK